MVSPDATLRIQIDKERTNLQIKANSMRCTTRNEVRFRWYYSTFRKGLDI